MVKLISTSFLTWWPTRSGFWKDWVRSSIQTCRHTHLPNYYPAGWIKKWSHKQTASAFAILAHVISKIIKAVFGTLLSKYPIFEHEIIEQVEESSRVLYSFYFLELFCFLQKGNNRYFSNLDLNINCAEVGKLVSGLDLVWQSKFLFFPSNRWRKKEARTSSVWSFDTIYEEIRPPFNQRDSGVSGTILTL